MAPRSTSWTRSLRWLAASAGAAALCAALWPLSSSADRATTEQLGGKQRYLTHVSTDKPIYRPGEMLYVRGVILHAIDRTPLDGFAQGTVEVIGPKGDKVATGWTQSQDSVLGFGWKIPEGTPGGEYTVRISYPQTGHPTAERKFDVRAFRAPRLRSQVVFLRDGYGPGDTVTASVHTERAEGGVPDGARVTVLGRVDGAEVYQGQAAIDFNGNCTVNFKLPAKIDRGEGSVAFVIEDGGVTETASKTLPILLQTVDLGLYPEGGELIAGLLNRVYLEARTPSQKPADLVGEVIDEKGVKVADFRTEHEGRGRLAFTPAVNGKYALKITQPAGISRTFPLPAVKASGVVLSALEDRTAREEAVKLRVRSTAGGKVRVTLSQREVEVASVKVDVPAGGLKEISLTPPATADGVLVATVWDEQGAALAERLVYRQPAKALNIEIRAEKERYVPGEQVRLKIRTTDADQKPVGAVVGVTVTDDAVLEMVEKREQAPRLPVMVLLEGEVRELADAHIYLDESNPRAAAAVDLLLGTQGWRRFALVDWQKFVKEHGDKAKRALAVVTPQPPAKFKGGRGEDGAWDGPPPPMAAGEARPMAAVPAKAEPAPAPEEEAGKKKENGALREDEQLVGQQQVQQGQQAANADEKNVPAPKVAQPPADRKDAEAAKRDAGVAAERVAEADVFDGDDEEIGARRMGGRRQIVRRGEANSFVQVRLYAHPLRPNRDPQKRTDFTQTIFWSAGVKTDEKTGEASVFFALNDSVTSFRVVADAFSRAGALGANTAVVESVQPFYIEPKLPLEVSAGDKVLLPLNVVNGIDSPYFDARLEASVKGPVKVSKVAPFNLESASRVRQILELEIGAHNGDAVFTATGTMGTFTDSVTRTFAIRPSGFPIEVGVGGMLQPNTPYTKVVQIPQDFVPQSLTGKVNVYPTPLANMTDALSALIREPHGCFEQTSSSNYPLIMAQQYFQSHTGVDPILIKRSAEQLDKGYQKLVGFECKQRGYEWFGGDPGHEALTAYGLLQFSDMAKVREVDAAMVGRTREWLLAKRDGKGGFARNDRALDSFGRAPATTTNAYCVWALVENGEKGLDAEVAAVKGSIGDDSYVNALAANILHKTGDAEGAARAMEKLAARQAADGSVDGAVTSITQSGGAALKIETTSLALLAWLKEPKFADQTEKAARFLAESCKGGRFGSTQSTILALRAIVAYDASRARPKAAGTLTVYVDGQPAGAPVAFGPDTQGALSLPDFASALKPGERKIEVRMDGGSPMPFSFQLKYNSPRPASSPECKVALKTDLAQNTVAEGALTEVNVTVTNKANEVIPTPVAIVGLPGGLEARHDQLKELVKQGRIDAYEVIGREVILYWRGLKGGETRTFPLSVTAAIPGTYSGPASRAYLYYTDEHKTWTDALKVSITPR